MNLTALVARILFPVVLVVAATLWLQGYAGVGDGFSAGVVAGLGALAQYAGLDHAQAARRAGARFAWRLVTGGLLLVLAVLVGPVFAGVAPVTHWPAPGAHVVRFGALELHTALLFDLGVALLVYGAVVGTFDRLFPTGPRPEEDRRP